MKNNENEEHPVRFFHVCTDGTKNDNVFFCDEDYEQAQKITAMAALKTDVHVIADCHMTTHSHFTLWCEAKAQAERFGDIFKHYHSIYIFATHHIPNAYKNIPVTVREIHDPWDLKNSIAYTLVNPVKAHMVQHPEEYRWSSFSCYFTSGTIGATPLASIPLRKACRLFHTHTDLRTSGLAINGKGNIVLKSFIDYRFAERLFGSPTEFFKSLAVIDYAKEELKYTPVIKTILFTDDELRAEAMALARTRFGTDSLIQLTLEQKIRLLQPLQRKTRASPTRIASILRMQSSLAKQLLEGR